MMDYTLDSLMVSMDNISSRAVVKQSKLADKYDKGIRLAPYYEARSAYFKSDTIYDYNVTYEDLDGYGLSEVDKNTIVNDVHTIYTIMDDKDVRVILEEKRVLRITSYDEPNLYYRMIYGLPSNNADVVFFSDPIEGVDISKPVHMLDNVEIQIVSVSGDLDRIISLNPDKSYLKYIDRKVSPFVARSASQFSLLHTDSSSDDTTMVNIFQERYEVHKRRFLASIYNDFYYTYQSFYEDVMIVYLLGVTMIDAVMVAADTDDIMNDDTLDKLYMSEGVPNWNLPTSVRISIGKNLNELVRVRASKKVITDIANIFGTDSVFRYVMDKRLKIDIFDENTPEDEKYDLNFFKIPYDKVDPYPYMHDVTSAIPYETFVNDDKKWGTNSDNMKAYFMNEKFSYIDTKYISIENMVDLGKVSFELALFYNYTFDNDHLLNAIRGQYDGTQHEVNLMNSLIYTMALISLKYSYTDSIFKDPEELVYVMGLNTEGDITVLNSEFNMEFMNTEYHGLLDDICKIRRDTDGELYSNTFINNIDIVYRLKDAMNDEGTSITQHNIALKAFETLTTMKVVNDTFDGYDTYSEYIGVNDPKLYQRYIYLKELDKEDEVNIEISDMIEFSKKLLNPNELQKIYDRLKFADEVDISRMNDMRDNLFMIINYFKSYTIDMKDFNTVYEYNDKTSSNRTIDWLEVGEYGDNWEMCQNRDIVDIVDSDEFKSVGTSKSILTIIDDRRVIEHVRT